MSDTLVRTYKSKQVAFDKSLVASLTEGESGFYLVCLTPQQRWLLLTLLEFYTLFRNRWVGGWTEDEIESLHASTLWRLICPMTCEDQFEALNATLATMSTTLTEIRDRIGDGEVSLDERLLDIKTSLDTIQASLPDDFPGDLFDKLEPILNGVGVILGAPTIPLNGG